MTAKVIGSTLLMRRPDFDAEVADSIDRGGGAGSITVVASSCSTIAGPSIRPLGSGGRRRRAFCHAPSRIARARPDRVLRLRCRA